MSMEEDINNLRQLKEDADMSDAVDQLNKIKLIIEHVVMGGEITLGLDHLGMSAINHAAGQVDGAVDALHQILVHFETTVKDVADAVIQSLS
jgi:hypothetical protein